MRRRSGAMPSQVASSLTALASIVRDKGEVQAAEAGERGLAIMRGAFPANSPRSFP